MNTVEQLRTQIGALQAERETISAQVMSRSEVENEIRKRVARGAEEANRIIDRAFLQMTLGVQNSDPLTADRIVGHANQYGQVETSIDLAPWLIAIAGEERVTDALIARLDNVREGMDAPKRLARLDAIAADLDRLETEEEQLIERNGKILRRGNSRPEIILRVSP